MPINLLPTLDPSLYELPTDNPSKHVSAGGKDYIVTPDNQSDIYVLAAADKSAKLGRPLSQDEKLSLSSAIGVAARAPQGGNGAYDPATIPAAPPDWSFGVFSQSQQTVANAWDSVTNTSDMVFSNTKKAVLATALGTWDATKSFSDAVTNPSASGIGSWIETNLTLVVIGIIAVGLIKYGPRLGK